MQEISSVSCAWFPGRWSRFFKPWRTLIVRRIIPRKTPFINAFSFHCLRPNSLHLALIGLKQKAQIWHPVQRKHGFQPWFVFHIYMTPIQDLQGNMFFTENILCVCVHNPPLQFRIVFAKVTSTKKYSLSHAILLKNHRRKKLRDSFIQAIPVDMNTLFQKEVRV